MSLARQRACETFIRENGVEAMQLLLETNHLRGELREHALSVIAQYREPSPVEPASAAEIHDEPEQDSDYVALAWVSLVLFIASVGLTVTAMRG